MKVLAGSMHDVPVGVNASHQPLLLLLLWVVQGASQHVSCVSKQQRKCGPGCTWSTARSHAAGLGVRGSRKGQFRCTGPSLPAWLAQRTAASTDVSTRRAGAAPWGAGRSAAHLV